MSNLFTIHPLPLAVGGLFLISMAGIQASHAADNAADPQVQAANVLQRPTVWVPGAGAVQGSGHRHYQALDSQNQAQRVLQPAHAADAAKPMGSRQFVASESIEPQLQAIRLLHHTFY